MANQFFFTHTKDFINKQFPSIFKGDTKQAPNLSRLTKYGWYNALYMCADGDLIKMQELEKKDVYSVMTFLNYKIDNNLEQNSKK